MDTDSEWERWGAKDPYFGVRTEERFRKGNMTAEIKKEFFDSGKSLIDHVIDQSRRHLDADFEPQRALDFGCGTGRMVIPLSRICKEAVGVDVSESMLREAENNCREFSIENVSLYKADDSLSSINGRFDFIHSYIVFQHIPADRGQQIFINLLDHLDDGGICVLHFTYAKTIFSDNHGASPVTPVILPESATRQFLDYLISVFKPRIARNSNELVEANDSDPQMQMNSYDMNAILFIVQSLGVVDMHIEYKDHGGELGAILFFQKPKMS